MDKQNKSHLIAGFFRYHREKLNYSLRGLVGDGSVVDLSSLSAFENGKRALNDEQLIWLFEKINFDYSHVINSYNFNKEYEIILDYIWLGETDKAEECFLECVNRNVYSSLGTVNFALLQYFLSNMNSNCVVYDDISNKLQIYYDTYQLSIKKIIDSIYERNHGNFSLAIETLREAEKISFESKAHAFISQQFGIYFGLIGNYAEATVAFIEAKRRFSAHIGFIQLVQININLGTIYTLTNSFDKAEESYLEAYRCAIMLKHSSYLLTKCFNNLCWLYFKTNQYNKILDFKTSEIENLVLSENTLFVLAWSNYKLFKVDECVKYCKEARNKYQNREYPQIVFTYIENAVLGKKSNQDKLLIKAINMKDREHTQMIDELFTYELIDIYERRKNYEKAFKYAKKLLNR